VNETDRGTKGGSFINIRRDDPGGPERLASRRLVYDRGRVLADLACAIADGAEVISDFRVMGEQQELVGLVASVPAAWYTLDEIARGAWRALGQIGAAVNAARRRALMVT
jgi:hypothetical protein